MHFVKDNQRLRFMAKTWIVNHFTSHNIWSLHPALPPSEKLLITDLRAESGSDFP
jgi:hypothetical protein